MLASTEKNEINRQCNGWKAKNRVWRPPARVVARELVRAIVSAKVLPAFPAFPALPSLLPPPRIFTALTLWLGVLLTAFPALNHAQSFFPEIAALREDSHFTIRLSENNYEFSNDVNGVVEQRRQESKENKISYNVLGGSFGFGIVYGDRDYLEQTASYQLTQQEELRAIYLAAVLDDILLNDDRWTVVLSNSNNYDRYDYDTYSNRAVYKNLARVGLMFQTGVFLLGYALGENEMELEVYDPGRPAFFNELYKYKTQVKVAGIEFGDGGYGLGILWERMDAPFVAGKQVDLKDIFANHVELRIGLGAVNVSASDTRVNLFFDPETFKDTQVSEASIGLSITASFRLSYTISERTEDVRFFFFGLPINNKTFSKTNAFTLDWRF